MYLCKDPVQRPLRCGCECELFLTVCLYYSFSLLSTTCSLEDLVFNGTIGGSRLARMGSIHSTSDAVVKEVEFEGLISAE